MSSNRDPADSLPQSLAAVLQNNSPVQDPLSEWFSSSPRDFSARLVHLTALPTGQVPTSSSYPSSPPYSHSVRSSSSMAPACIHQSNASTHPPSLYNHSDVTPTETSISTGIASQFSGVPLLEEVNGVLERRPNQFKPAMYECAFWFLSCTYASNDMEEWEVHCLSHFRGEEPPRSVQCPLCDWNTTCEDGATAWNHRMRHIASWHAMLGHTLKTSRPDFHLFQHLWQKRLIDDSDLKELKGGNHNLTRPPSNYTSTNRPRDRDRDRERGRGQRSRRQHIPARRPVNPVPA